LDVLGEILIQEKLDVFGEILIQEKLDVLGEILLTSDERLILAVESLLILEDLFSFRPQTLSPFFTSTFSQNKENLHEPLSSHYRLKRCEGIFYVPLRNKLILYKTFISLLPSHRREFN
jgi:hypothetical protein